jgi:hypothetical protein
MVRREEEKLKINKGRVEINSEAGELTTRMGVLELWCWRSS